MSHAWMPLYVSDYLADTGHLSTVEHGAYMLLIMHYWQTGGLPDDERKLSRIARLSADEWGAVRDTLADLFCDGWTHSRIDAELAHASDVISKRSAAARAMHERRKADQRQNECTSDANASANAEHANMQNAIPSPSPLPVYDANASHTKRERAGDDWPADYRDQFWRAYPHRVGKSAALAKLDRIRKSGGVTFARLMGGLSAYIASKPADRQWCNPATWLNQGRWDDEPSIDDGKPAFGGQRASGAPRPDPVVSAMVAMCNRGARSPTAEPPFDPFSPRPDGGTAGDGWPDDRTIDLAPVAGGRSGNHAGGGGGPSLFAIQGGGRWGGGR